MKTAVVFYSHDGNSKFIAKQIKSQTGADLIQLYTKDEKKRGKFASILWGCAMVFMNKKPPLKPYDFDPSPYDLIVFGAPVWAASPAPPIKTFLSQTVITGKKIALFVCHAGGKEDALDKFKALLSGNEIISAADFKNSLKNIEEAQQQTSDWIKGW
ncbi:MAG: flavodoxin [Treponema sp.]|jgi:flavodoxin|nr:flavodoxin [Treponema sp.]